MRKCKYSLLLFVLLFVNLGCSNSKLFEEYIKFEKLSWNRFNYLEFEVPIENTESEFDVYVTLRHLPEFPHKELPINLTIYSPSGEMRSSELVLELADKEGNNLSKCMGDFCDVSILVRKELTFYETGIFKFRLENKWKKVELPGIMEVGLTIKKS